MTREDMFSLRGKVAVVTGGARGIGKTVGGHLAMMGADVAIIDLLIEEAGETASQIAADHKTTVRAYRCDVTSPGEVNATIEKIADDFGGLDVLFNNAGICQHKAALDVTPDEWKTIYDVNVNGVFYMAQAFAKKLISLGRGGSIINTASMSGTIVNLPQEQASYNSSKAAVAHMTKSLAVEWARYGIRVNSLSPGYIFTEMTASVAKEMTDYWVSVTPFKRMGTPEELSGAVIYLASDCASYTSGCDLIADGCFTCT
ncbi:MAG: SDR family oxidoreductase [Defluviitaleaceae bacterium]|nr:SDR family oxidoreductase [Defluviitaleaceae bacterium]